MFCWRMAAGANSVVVKDLSRAPLWFRWVFGRHAMKREWRAMETLRDLKGVPQPVRSN